MRKLRFILVFIFFVLFSGIIIYRLTSLQILNAPLYKALAEGLHLTPQKQSIERGEIFFQKGEPLAINKNWQLVWIIPNKVNEKEVMAQKLSEILEIEKEVILEKLNIDRIYVPIKYKLQEEEVLRIKELNLSGIYFDTFRGRYYPQETLASQVIGFVGGTGEGQYGLEGEYNNILFQNEKNVGNDLLLNLDYKIQFMAEKLLAEDGKELQITSGQIVVIEPQTGKILALANFPNFNPNEYEEFAKKDLFIFQNSVTQKIFEPGSVFKPITFAAALNEGKITPETTYIDTGKVVIKGWTISNYGERVYGETQMTEVLEKSINTGAVFVENKIGHETFLDYIGKFGFFEKTHIDLPEIASENKELKRGYEINFATASFGQGIEVTPIQLVRAYCAIANGGKLVRPYLVNKILDKNGRVVEEIQPEISENSIISQKTARELTAMLVNVVEKGFAKRARIEGYYIAGKTGTAMIPWSALGIDKKGYSEKTWQSFVGYFPAFDPKILILVKLDNPATKTAEYSAVPIFRKLAEFIINYLQIPPDYQ